jgi:hypothetical protein
MNVVETKLKKLGLAGPACRWEIYCFCPVTIPAGR